MQRRPLLEGRIGALELRAALEESGDARLIEPRADVTCIAQRLALAVAEQQRSEWLARAVTARVAADEEFARLNRLQFQPVARASSLPVGTALALGDDALEAMLECGGIELLGVIGSMHQLQVRSRQQALREVATAVGVGCGAQVESREVQQIEAHQHHGT